MDKELIERDKMSKQYEFEFGCGSKTKRRLKRYSRKAVRRKNKVKGEKE